MLLYRPAPLRAVRQLVEPSDLPLALDAGGMLGRQALNKVADAVAQLEREVGGGGPHQLAHILHCRLAAHATALLVLAHRRSGTLSAREHSPGPGSAR